jgi:LCP family protein required for cell wall assembly
METPEEQVYADMTDIKVASPKKTFAKFFAITFIVILALCVGGLTVFNSMLDRQFFDKGTVSVDSSSEIGMLVPADGIFTEDPEFVNSDRINMLLLGTTKEKLSDTIMLVSYDQTTNDIDIISVPRDTYYEREGHPTLGERKINAAYWGDPKSSAEAVHEVLLGIPINYYAVVDYEGVANIVDAIGGVEVDVPFDMNYEKHSEDPPLIIHLKAGKQTLKGKDAVGYLRYRSGYTDGDFGRVGAQQEFVKAAIKQSFGLNLPSVARAAIENVDSDVTLRTILSLISDVTDSDSTKSGASSKSVDTYIIPGNAATYEALSFYFCDEAQTEDMLRSIYSGMDFEATTSAITGPDDPNFYAADDYETEESDSDSEETYE